MSLIHQHIAFGPGASPWEPWDNGKLKSRPLPHQVQVAQQEDIPVLGFVKPLRGRSISAGLPLKRRPRIPTENSADLEALADKLEEAAETTVVLPRKYLLQSLRPRLLSILANTQEASSAWAAYRALLVLPRSPDKVRPKVPFAHRHRLLRLLAVTQPRPRGRYAQVLAVLRALLQAGGTVKLWEWNLLLDCAGKEGWRRPREEHFRVALALIAQMRRHPPPASVTSPPPQPPPHHHSSSSAATNAGRDGGLIDEGGATPDIFSYTTLLAHAVRTRAPAAVRHAAQLLARSGFALGEHAHTTLLCYFARRGDLAGVRETLFRMRRAGGGGLAQAAFNVVLWAFAYNGRLDVARAMYRVVRGGGGEGEEEEVEELKNALAEREMIVVEPEVVVPDIATYHILIQAYAYHGDLRASLETLADMLSSSVSCSEGGEEGKDIKNNDGRRGNSLTAFRAIFLGFARHGVFVSPHTSLTPNRDHRPPLPISQKRLRPTLTSSTTSSSVLTGTISSSISKGEGEWTLTTLEALFTRFLELPTDTRLRENVLFWLISAFARTSGHDPLVLRDVFERLESRFGCGGGEGVGGLRGWSGRLARIREKVFSSCSLEDFSPPKS